MKSKVTALALTFLMLVLIGCESDMDKIRKEDALRAERLETLKELQQHASQEAIVLSKSEFEGGFIFVLKIPLVINKQKYSQNCILLVSRETNFSCQTPEPEIKSFKEEEKEAFNIIRRFIPDFDQLEMNSNLAKWVETTSPSGLTYRQTLDKAYETLNVETFISVINTFKNEEMLQKQSRLTPSNGNSDNWWEEYPLANDAQNKGINLFEKYNINRESQEEVKKGGLFEELGIDVKKTTDKSTKNPFDKFD